ncbi:MAG: hypothetical protein U5M23_16165 [Marinagarivorans sp.]|nr:hypothetical protein [Marinagarivorans sp.]
MSHKEKGSHRHGNYCEIKFLGGKEFVEKMQLLMDSDKDIVEVPLAQRRPTAKTIAEYEAQTEHPNDAILKAYKSGGYTLKEIGDYFGLHYSTISGIISNHKSKT